MNFFRKCECIRGCYLVISSNLLKRSIRKTSIFVLFRQLLKKKCYVSCIFQVIIVIVVIKILEKYLLKSSGLEMNFSKLFVSILTQYLNHSF